MIDLFSQQDLALFGPFSLCDVGSNAAEPDEAAAFVEAGCCGAGAPTDFAVRPEHAKLGLECVGLLGRLAKCAYQQLEILRVNERLHAVECGHESAWHPKNLALALIPDRRASRYVPFPAAHLSGSKRKASQALALTKLQRRSRQFCSAFRNARFQTFVQLFKLARLAKELDEHPHFRAQN